MIEPVQSSQAVVLVPQSEEEKEREEQEIEHKKHARKTFLRDARSSTRSRSASQKAEKEIEAVEDFKKAEREMKDSF